MTLQSLDIKRRSATTTPSPSVRETIEVAKLIDVITSYSIHYTKLYDKKKRKIKINFNQR